MQLSVSSIEHHLVEAAFACGATNRAAAATALRAIMKRIWILLAFPSL
jgi:hypothetical protein